MKRFSAFHLLVPLFIYGLTVAPLAAQTVSSQNTTSQTGTTYNDLPTYRYNPATDPLNHPYVTPKAVDKKVDDTSFGLGTLTGYEVGIQVADYGYHEFSPDGSQFISLLGPTFGASFDGMKSYSNGWFWGGEARVDYGDMDYKGGDVNLITNVNTPSTKSGIDDWMFEARLLGGHDFFFDSINMAISPYAGLGFRFLYDDGTGADSNGVTGYDRFSHYLYLPVGITPRWRLTAHSRLSVNLEYDQLLYGWQVSSIGESIPGTGDLTNTQSGGFGFRGSIMYERPHWSIGPFFDFWDIDESNIACSGGFCGDEPHNTTFETGVQAKYRF